MNGENGIMKKSFCMIAAACSALLFGCMSFDYEGKSEAPVRPADDIRIFNDATAIKEPYSVLGTATVSGVWAKIEKQKTSVARNITFFIIKTPFYL